MLAERFQDLELTRLAAANAAQQARADRDAFIQAQFPLLDAAFSALVAAAVGSDPKLAIVSTPATDTFTNHAFASLAKTITAVRSTLYGPAETVTFTPGLQSVYPDQFGIIRITTDGLPEPTSARAAAVLARGILMRGATSASLVVPAGENFTTLTAALLEEFLAALFIRNG